MIYLKEYSLFDIIGPIMIGPSSSHTAGACRIGYMARSIIKKDIKEVVFELYGSFAKTYKGHGTDIALLGGILGFKQDDKRIVDSYNIAKERGLKFNFEPLEKEMDHPNTVIIKAKSSDEQDWEIKGVSIGGGKMVIESINGIDIQFTGEFNTIVTHHNDSPGMLALIANVLAKEKINIANMKLYREEKGKKAICIIENDESVPKETVDELISIEGISYVNLIEKVYE